MQLLSKNTPKEINFQHIAPMEPVEVKKALIRIEKYINKTPLAESEILNGWLGHKIVFKAEMFQKTGAFKARGALNALLKLKEEGNFPKRIVAFSSGNHSQGVAWATKMLGVPATIYLPENVSKIKKDATRFYGATVIETKTRQEAERMAREEVNNGSHLIPPFDDDDVIAGQGTCCLEALEEGIEPDAVFIPCGGGGLAAGTLLATRLKNLKSKIFPTEPEMANDAARSYKSGQVFTFHEQPKTLADGARTLGLSERTFHYLRQMDGVMEVSEESIIYWTQWLTHLLKLTVEPSSAMAMGGAIQWLKTQKEKKTVLVILSGGNISAESQKKIWENDMLSRYPTLKEIL